MEQMTIIASYTWKRKKEPKATRPMLQSICDYRLPLHACIQDISSKNKFGVKKICSPKELNISLQFNILNTAPVSQATMYKK